MIGSFIAGAAIGLIAGWAISSWRHARDEAPPAANGINAIGLGDGCGGHYIDAHYARMLKPVGAVAFAGILDCCRSRSRAEAASRKDSCA
jgi:hypothetical protein